MASTAFVDTEPLASLFFPLAVITLVWLHNNCQRGWFIDSAVGYLPCGVTAIVKSTWNCTCTNSHSIPVAFLFMLFA